MRVDRITGRMGVARIPFELFPGDGLVALLGDERAREAARSLVVSLVVGGDRGRPRLIREASVLTSVEADGSSFELRGGRAHDRERLRLQSSVDLDGEALALVWAGVGPPDDRLSSLVDAGARLVARDAGLRRVEGALAVLTRLPGVEDALEAAEAAAAEAGNGARGPTARARLVRAERDLRSLRADAAEIHGDLDEATMEWLRERQDAETTLLAYRDRARELKARLHQLEHGGPGTACPTCGRELDDQYDTVAEQLREEWESVVQDGQWWKRRHEQLEPKPERVRHLESRALRFQAAIEEAAEKAEHLRTELGVRIQENGGVARVSEPDALAVSEVAASLEDPRRAAVALCDLATELTAEARTTLLSATSRTLNRISGGRLIGLEHSDDPSADLVPRPVTGAPTSQDVAAAHVSLHLALARILGSRSVPLASLFVGERFSSLAEEDQLRAVAMLTRMRRRFPQILVLPGTAVVDANPEAFDAVWEFRPVFEDDGDALRSLPVGVGTIALAAD